MTLRKNAILTLTVVVVLTAVAALAVACGNEGSGSGGGAYGGGGGAVMPTGSPGGSPAGNGERQEVTIQDSSFNPDTLTIATGTTVVWTNADTVGHTVTSADGLEVDAATTGAFDSGILDQGDTFEFTFDEPGTYYYLCTPHRSMASMHAEVVVE